MDYGTRRRAPACRGTCEHGEVTARIERVKACLNGGRGRDEHPAVPVTAAQLAAAASAAVAAGAEAVHLHPRGEGGAESLRAADVGAAVEAVRQACPGVPVGVTTGLWITGEDVAARRAATAGWSGLAPAQRPDFASVNLSEPGAPGVLAALDAAGVAAEAGVSSVADARAAGAVGPGRGWLRILAEIPAAPAAAALDLADAVLRELRAAGVTAPVLLHGEDESCWPLVRRAGQLGLATRIGLEDVLTGPEGEPVTGNADLTRRALAIWTAASAEGRWR
jgi:uncharacterized protein (DUF849 family)